LLVDANQFAPELECYLVSDSTEKISLSDALDEIIELVAERNFDTYEAMDGNIQKT
jgi:hypothetical protein